MKITKYALSLDSWRPMMRLLSMGHHSKPVRYYLWQRHFEELADDEVAHAIGEIILATKAQPRDGILERYLDLSRLGPETSCPAASAEPRQPKSASAAPTSPQPSCKPPSL